MACVSAPPLDGAADHELFKLYGAVLQELRRRGLVRTANAPSGDYAEYLVALALQGALAPNSEKSWDVRMASGRRIQVKSRVVTEVRNQGQRQLSPFRSFEFDDLVIVLFGPDYSVLRAVMLPVEVAHALSHHRAHVNGQVLLATERTLASAGTSDFTELLRGVASRVREEQPPASPQRSTDNT